MKLFAFFAILVLAGFVLSRILVRIMRRVYASGRRSLHPPPARRVPAPPPAPKRAAPPPSPPSPSFLAAGALLQLAVMVCTADDTISPAERTLLERHIAQAPGVSAEERSRLREQLATLLVSKPNFRGVKKRLEALDPAQRAAIADLLIGIAGADGQVAPDEIRLLGRIYPMLGFSAEDVYSRIHAMAAGAMSDATAPATSAAPTASAAAAPAAPIRLNMSAVQAKLAQSAEVSALLGDIFSEREQSEREQPEAARPAAASAVPAATRPAVPPGGLSPAHRQLLTRLAQQAEWTRQEIDAMAAELDLLPDGAIDALNEAAFDRTGGPLLEGDDPIHVDQTIAKDLLT